MNVLDKKLAALLTVLVAAMLALSACVPAQTGTAQPATTAPAAADAEPGNLTVEGSLMPVRSTTLGFAAAGKLGEILAGEGQEVSQGDVLARMGDLEALEAALSQARLEQISAQQALDDLNASADLLRTQSAQALVDAQQALVEAQKALNQLDTDEFQDKLDDLNDAIDDAKEKLDDAQEKVDEYKDRDPEDATRKDAQEEYDDAEREYEDAIYDRDSWANRLEQAKAAVDVAQARVDDAQQVSDAHQKGPDPDDLALAQARLDNADAQAAAAQNALDNTVLTAPYDAQVVEVNDLEPGEMVTPGTMVAIVADYSEWVVETRDLSELDVVEVEAGQSVTVVPDALPDLELAGVIESVDRLYTESRGDIVYTVHIHLEEADPRLRWGMTVTVTFE